MTSQTIKSGIVADAFFKLLADRGVNYLFANAGTDFAPVIEAYAKAEVEGGDLPAPLAIPHENVAVSMAHGYYLTTGRPQAVMVHVNVGTANGICGLINAARDNVPIIFMAGRTPLTETELHGSRSGSIHWAQEMFDQAGMVREAVKWDYELRNGEQVEAVIDRAIEVAMAEPRGPVYLSLPREVLGYEIEEFSYQSPARRVLASPAAADPAAIGEAADLVAAAVKPVILTRTGGRNARTAKALADLAEQFALPVVEFRPVYNGLDSNHPMNMGYDVRSYLEVADVVLAIDTDAPWLVDSHGQPPESCQVIHIGVDPIFQNYPIRGFTRDLAIAADPGSALEALKAALEERAEGAAARVDTRRTRLAKIRDEDTVRKAGIRDKAKSDTPIHPAYASHVLSEQLDDETLIFNDYPLLLPHMDIRPNSYFGTPLAGGLGWGTGAALGAKLAHPEKTVISAVGDGSYMFGNPVAAHQVAKAIDLPVLFLVFNNSMWFAVRRATLGMYPDGYASKSNKMPLTMIEPSPDFEKIMALYDGYGEKVEDPAELPGAIERALNAVRNEKRQALLNIICSAVY